MRSHLICSLPTPVGCGFCLRCMFGLTCPPLLSYVFFSHCITCSRPSFPGMGVYLSLLAAVALYLFPSPADVSLTRSSFACEASAPLFPYYFLLRYIFFSLPTSLIYLKWLRCARLLFYVPWVHGPWPLSPPQLHRFPFSDHSLPAFWSRFRAPWPAPACLSAPLAYSYKVPQWAYRLGFSPDVENYPSFAFPGVLAPRFW